ncbi:MAG TPA: sigma 54-interacting transcriptional regulator, partial [archaeon]|nr:sigma 54-interacting transcriptional regulator [archaeon]
PPLSRSFPAQAMGPSSRRLVGRSRATQEVYRLIDLAAPTTAPVLIAGESGTGKELVARRLHTLSLRGLDPRAWPRASDGLCRQLDRDKYEGRTYVSQVSGGGFREDTRLFVLTRRRGDR